MKNKLEQALAIAEKIKKCNATAKRLFREEYDEKIGRYKAIIKACMTEHSLPALEATMKLIEDINSQTGEAGMTTMLLMAAVYEIEK